MEEPTTGARRRDKLLRIVTVLGTALRVIVAVADIFRKSSPPASTGADSTGRSSESLMAETTGAANRRKARQSGPRSPGAGRSGPRPIASRLPEGE